MIKVLSRVVALQIASLCYLLLNPFEFLLGNSVLAERQETEQYHERREEAEDDAHTSNQTLRLDSFPDKAG